MEHLLELRIEVISNLSEAMKGSKTDLRVLVLAVLLNNGDHLGNLIDAVDVLTNLRESHNTGMFVAPVSVVLNSCSDKMTE